MTKNNSKPAAIDLTGATIDPTAFDNFVNGLSVEDQIGRKFKPAMLAECLPGAGDALAVDWARKAGLETSGEDHEDRAAVLAERIGTDVLATVRARMLELARAIESGAPLLSVDDVSVSKNGARVSARVTVRDDETGASAQIGVSLPTSSTYGSALAAVAPERTR